MADANIETSHANHAQKHHGAGRYVVVLAALGALTASTFLVSRVQMSEDAHLFAALAIAAVKVSLVVLFFMHLWEAEGANKMIFIISIFFVGVVMWFVLQDVNHRYKLTNTQQRWMVPIDFNQYPAEGAEKAGPNNEKPAE